MMALHIFSNESVTLVPHFSEAFSRLHSSIVSQGLSSRKKLIRSVEAAFAGAHQPGHDSGEAWGHGLAAAGVKRLTAAGQSHLGPMHHPDAKTVSNLKKSSMI